MSFPQFFPLFCQSKVFKSLDAAVDILVIFKNKIFSVSSRGIGRLVTKFYLILGLTQALIIHVDVFAHPLVVADVHVLVVKIPSLNCEIYSSLSFVELINEEYWHLRLDTDLNWFNVREDFNKLQIFTRWFNDWISTAVAAWKSHHWQLMKYFVYKEEKLSVCPLSQPSSQD